MNYLRISKLIKMNNHNLYQLKKMMNSDFFWEHGQSSNNLILRGTVKVRMDQLLVLGIMNPYLVILNLFYKSSIISQVLVWSSPELSELFLSFLRQNPIWLSKNSRKILLGSAREDVSLRLQLLFTLFSSEFCYPQQNLSLGLSSNT